MRAVRALLIATMVLLPFAGTLRAEEEPAGELVLRLYPVGALTMGRVSYVRPAEPVVGPHSTSDEGRPLFGRPLEEPTYPLGIADELIEMLRMSVSPWFWEERDGADVMALTEQVIAVRATPEVHAGISRHLAEFERLLGRTVTIELESWRVPAARAEALLAAGATAQAEEGAIEPLRAHGVMGPSVSITAYSGQMAVAWGGRQISWIGDADVEVAQESATSDPIVLVSNLGLMVQAMAAVAPDDTILLGLDAALADLALQRTLATNENGAIHAPHHAVARIRPVVRVASGRWTVLDGQVPAGGDGAWMFLARATVHDVERRAGEGAEGSIDLGSPGEGRPTADAMALRYFDVRDLTTPVRNLQSRVPSLTPSNYTPPEPPEVMEPEPAVALDHLVDLLREGDREDCWEDPAAIEGRNGMLIVRNTPETLARVEARIAALRRASPWTLVVAAEIVDVPAALAAEFTDRGPQHEEALATLAGARRSGDAVSVDGLRLTSMRGARNVVRRGTVVSYLQDYEVEIAQASAIGNPVMQEVFSGSQLALAAGLASDRRAVQLEVDFVRTAVPMPMPRMHTIHGDIELPELEIFQLRTAVHAPLGRTVLVGSWAHDGRRRLLLLTPTLR